MAYQLNPQQAQIARTGLQLTQQDPAIVKRSLIEAMLVESGMRQIPGGDRDSVGVLQQRPSMGWGAYQPGIQGATQDMNDYLSRARRLVRGGFAGTAGQLAQAVQRSAYPGRYDERKGAALSIINQYGMGGHGPVGDIGATSPSPNQPQLGGDQIRKTMMQNLIDQQSAFASGQQYTGPTMTQALAQVQLSARNTANKLATHASTLAKDGNPGGASVVATAEKYLGTPYLWGGSKPGGFDCSGLLQFSYAQRGINIPRTSQEQWKAGSPVGKDQLQPGDAVFFEGGPSGPGHVGMFVGNGKFIEAPHTGAQVRISTLKGRSDFVGARRFTQG